MLSNARRDSERNDMVRTFARMLRVVLTVCFVTLAVATLAWLGWERIEGDRQARVIEQGWQASASAARPTPPVEFRAGDIIGRIVIPRLGLDSPLVEMGDVDDLANLDRGPSHIAGTALPGAAGNCVVAGHRTTHTRPFSNLDQLVRGDELRFVDLAGSASVYSVAELLVVAPDEVGVMSQTQDATVTLIACHPPYSARWRLIVKATRR